MGKIVRSFRFKASWTSLQEDCGRIVEGVWNSREVCTDQIQYAHQNMDRCHAYLRRWKLANSNAVKETHSGNISTSVSITGYS